MMKKLYYAYVAEDMVSYFEEKLEELKDRIDVIRISSAISENNNPLKYYVLAAEEGIIDSKWELKWIK